MMVLVVLCMHGLGCDGSDSDDEVPGDLDGGEDDADVRTPVAPRRPRNLDGSVPRAAKPDAGAPRAGTGATEDPEDLDAGADWDGGDELVREGIRYEGGDGSSCEKAVIILGAPNELSGVFAEYEWLDRRYPGFDVLSQALLICNGAHTDALDVRLANGRTIDVYFNIDDFFGK